MFDTYITKKVDVPADQKCPRCGQNSMVWQNFVKREGYCYKCAFNTTYDKLNNN